MNIPGFGIQHGFLVWSLTNFNQPQLQTLHLGSKRWWTSQKIMQGDKLVQGGLLGWSKFQKPNQEGFKLFFGTIFDNCQLSLCYVHVKPLFYNILSDCYNSDEINYLLNAFRLKKKLYKGESPQIFKHFDGPVIMAAG